MPSSCNLLKEDVNNSLGESGTPLQIVAPSGGGGELHFLDCTVLETTIKSLQLRQRTQERHSHRGLQARALDLQVLAKTNTVVSPYPFCSPIPLVSATQRPNQTMGTTTPVSQAPNQVLTAQRDHKSFSSSRPCKSFRDSRVYTLTSTVSQQTCSRITISRPLQVRRGQELGRESSETPQPIMRGCMAPSGTRDACRGLLWRGCGAWLVLLSQLSNCCTLAWPLKPGRLQVLTRRNQSSVSRTYDTYIETCIHRKGEKGGGAAHAALTL